jgi:hypothetical protein
MTWTFNPHAYTSVVAELLSGDRMPALGPGTPNATARPRLEALTIESLFGAQAIRDADMARCCLSALWLLNDCLDESHQISQEIDTPSGSCWHAIMHRREPDAGNSKYWWRRVGQHPFLVPLREETAVLGYAYATPAAFVDFCERVRETGSEDEKLARQVQLLEWRILFDWCWRQSL